MSASTTTLKKSKTIDLDKKEKSPQEASDASASFNDNDDANAQSTPSATTAQTVSATKAEIAQEKARQKQLKDEQKKALELVRAQQKATVAAANAASQSSRLQYLIQQSDVFAHFLGGVHAADAAADGATAAAAAGVKSKGRRGRKSEAAEDKAILDEALHDGEDGGTVRLSKQPDAIQNGSMRPYQIEGLNWLIRLYDNGISGILADEMGLGKTLQTISLLAYLAEARGITGPHIVIVPKSTLGNWNREFNKWFPACRVRKFHGDKDERAAFIRDQLAPNSFDVVLTSYEIAVIEKTALAKFGFQYLIIDEAHRIKNENAKLSTVVRDFDTANRLLLTGTPLQNNLHELWALLNFLLPDVFSSSDDFDEWFNLADKDQEEQVIGKLHKVLRPFLLRRLKSDVTKELPPKREVKLYVPLSAMQREWYRKLLLKDLEVVNAGGRESKLRLMNIAMQLRKLANHPYLFDGAEPGPPFTTDVHLIQNSGKLVVLDKLLPKLQARGSRVLIFSQMTRLLDILEDYMQFRNYSYVRLDGSTPGEEREDSIVEFNKPGSTLFAFLLSTRAGGLGINLATADTVILYDSDWNPQMDLQAQDRAHRIGQTKPVTVYRLVTENTIEEKVIERAERKLYLDARVIQQGRLVDKAKGVDKSELLSMIRFGADAVFRKQEGEGVTDEDIDVIIARGEERTAKSREALQAQDNSLSQFKLDGRLDGAEQQTSVYEYEGQDYRALQQRAQEQLSTWIEPPKRERKANYEIDRYYREVLKTNARQGGAPTRPPRQPLVYDHQFFPAALHTLFDKETTLWKAGLEAQKKRAADDAGKFDDAPYRLSDADEREKQALLRRGFQDWGRREFFLFIKACESHGRTAYAAIAAELGTKTEKEVRAYSAVFWKNVHKIEGYERYVAAIEKGEKRRERESQMEQILAKKVSQYKQPWSELQIKYGASKSKIYLEDEDQFLVCMTHELGYGEWDALKDEVRRAWQFRFDWFIKSRSAAELGRRVDVLIRIIEKEGRKPKPSSAAAVTITEPSKPKPRTTANSSSVVASALPPRKRARKAAAATASTNENDAATGDDNDDGDDDDENNDDNNDDNDNNDNDVMKSVDADLARLAEEEMQAAEDAELRAVIANEADEEFESVQSASASASDKKRKGGAAPVRAKRGNNGK
jgi:superfamily II DNA or RNA helicase